MLIFAFDLFGAMGTVLSTLFIAAVGTVALALALAFGLAGRETAAGLLRGWFNPTQPLPVHAVATPTLIEARRGTTGFRVPQALPVAVQASPAAASPKVEETPAAAVPGPADNRPQLPAFLADEQVRPSVTQSDRRDRGGA